MPVNALAILHIDVVEIQKYNYIVHTKQTIAISAGVGFVVVYFFCSCRNAVAEKYTSDQRCKTE